MDKLPLRLAFPRQATAMEAEQQGEESDLILCCPPSPFDHQASFIPFDRVDPPLTCPRTVIFTPNLVTLPDIHINQALRGAQNHRAVSGVGIIHLAKSMGYRSRKVGMREAELIEADALTLIEKLTAGRPITKRPRDLQPWRVRIKLLKMIPDKFFRSCDSGFDRSATWRCDEDALDEAASDFIKALMEHKSQRNERDKNNSKIFTLYSHENPEQLSGKESELISRTLSRLESWCDDWLEGRLALEDWDKMEDRL